MPVTSSTGPAPARMALFAQSLLRSAGCRVAAVIAAVVLSGFATFSAASAADPAVVHMDRVAKDLMAASRTRSPQAMQGAIARHGDLAGLGFYALGDYRPRLEASDKDPYLNGMTRFLGRYAAGEAPKYPVQRVAFAPESRRAKYGLMVDSTVVMQDGTQHEVAWLLVKSGSSYRVRDAQVLGVWMSPFLKKLFEDYIGQNNGNVKALVAVLQRH